MWVVGPDLAYAVRGQAQQLQLPLLVQALDAADGVILVPRTHHQSRACMESGFENKVWQRRLGLMRCALGMGWIKFGGVRTDNNPPAGTAREG